MYDNNTINLSKANFNKIRSNHNKAPRPKPTGHDYFI